MHPQQNGWRNFISFWLATPWRSLALIVLVVAIILSGILRLLVHAFMANVFEPLLIMALLVAIIFYVLNPGKRK